jgi:hypothetical protein
MAGRTNYINLNKISADRITIGDYSFVRALVVRSHKPMVLEPAQERTGEPLFALPGGGVATEKEIVTMLKAAA